MRIARSTLFRTWFTTWPTPESPHRWWTI